MKLKLLGASALTLALALAGAPAASANTAVLPVGTFYLYTHENGTPLCVSQDVEHGQEVFLTSFTDDCMPFDLIYPATSTNGNLWLEMQMVDNSNCLNYVLGPSVGLAYVESDSCQKNDENELWYNKYQVETNTAFENWEGNVSTGYETYLKPLWNANTETWDVVASTNPFRGWDEVNT
jgi:hypothetical protein